MGHSLRGKNKMKGEDIEKATQVRKLKIKFKKKEVNIGKKKVQVEKTDK